MKIRKPFFTAVSILCLFSALSAGDEVCKPIESPVTFERIAATLQACRIVRIESLLPLLPANFRSRYVLVYASRSLQGATPRHPRVIMFGLDARFILAFSGSPESKGYDLIETIEFDDRAKKFNFRSIEFPSERTNTVTEESALSPRISERNPSLCMSCHRQELRPNWDSYAGWPGVYGSTDDTLPAAEKEQYQNFQNNVFMKEGRYRYFEDPGKYPEGSGYIDYYKRNRPNLQFNLLISRLSSQANARALKENKQLHKFRYAMLAAVNCPDDFSNAQTLQELAPPAVADALTQSIPVNDKLVVEGVMKSYALREERQCNILKSLGGKAPVTHWECTFPDKELGYTAATSRLKSVMETAGVAFPEWSTEFGSRNHVFFAGVVGEVGELGLFLWQELLNPENDREIYGMYQQAWENRNKWGIMVFASGKKNLCRALQKKSLETLTSDSHEMN